MYNTEKTISSLKFEKKKTTQLAEIVNPDWKSNLGATIDIIIIIIASLTSTPFQCINNIKNNNKIFNLYFKWFKS